LAVGEALISLLDEKGRPSVTERAFVVPPASRIGPNSDEERKALIAGSLVVGVYEKAVDRESAYEKLTSRTATAQATAGAATSGGAAGAALPGTTAAGGSAAGGGMLDGLKDVLFGSTGPRGGKHEGLAEAAARSAVRTIGSSVGREIIRGVLGGILGGKSRR
nr:helicase HerA-like domain-containing protein [Caldimonas sp.]